MRTETLIAIMNKIRLEKDTKPRRILNTSQLKTICYKGISDEQIITIVIPKLIQWEIDGDFSKEKLKAFLEESPELARLPTPKHHAIDKTTEQRRMDSLARLLAVENSISPCIAVAFYEGRLIISSNSPKEKTTEELESYILQKMAIIREFLAKLTTDVVIDEELIDVTKIQFSLRARLLAEEAINNLMKKECGSFGDVLPPRDSRQRSNAEEHLKNALFKIGQAYLLSLYTNGKKGFSKKDALALFGGSITIFIPNSKELANQQLHAEQAILYYLNKFTDFETKLPFDKINIGISKLCCQACFAVLSRRLEKISFRGGHGISFPNVHDIDTKSLFEGVKTLQNNFLCASDSESECEFYEEPAEHVLSLEELIDPTQEKEEETLRTNSSLASYSKNLLFKPCSDEVKEPTLLEVDLRKVTNM